jgi:hypothetical protein
MNVQGTVWADIQDNDVLDKLSMKEIESLFAVQVRYFLSLLFHYSHFLAFDVSFS